jgi:hypothetical protein
LNRFPRLPQRRRVLAAALLALLFPGEGSLAAAPVACHCFRERTFDPDRPATADPYILATSQNSFFAVVFGLPKKAVVQAKMKGVSGDDLWIAYYASSVLRLQPGILMASRERAASWKEALEGQEGNLTPLGTRFLGLLENGGGNAHLSAAAACEVLAMRLGIPWSGLDALLAGRAAAAEIVAASLLSQWSQRPAAAILQDVKSGKTTWGSLMHGLGIQPEGLEKKIRALAARSAPPGEGP